MTKTQGNAQGKKTQTDWCWLQPWYDKLLLAKGSDYLELTTVQTAEIKSQLHMVSANWDIYITKDGTAATEEGRWGYLHKIKASKYSKTDEGITFLIDVNLILALAEKLTAGWRRVIFPQGCG